MNQATAPSFSQRIQQNSALIFIAGLVCVFGYVTLKDSGPGMLIYAVGFFGAFIFFMSGLYRGLFKREVATYLLVAYLPFSMQIPIDFGNVITGLNFTNIMILFVAYLWFKSRDKSKPVLSKTALNVPIFIFLGLGIFSILRGMGYGMDYLAEASIEFYRRWITAFFLYFFIVNSNHDKEVMKNIVRIIMMVTAFVALMAIYEYRDIDDRVGGVFNQPNHLAAFFNYYLYLFFGFFLVYKKRSWIFLLPFIICFRGIMVTFSRAGYLAFAAGMYAIICFRSRILLFFLVLATVFLFFNPAFLPEGIRYRMAQTFEKQKTQQIEPGTELNADSLDASAAERLKVWEGAMVMIREHPIFGIGFYTFEKKILHYWIGTKSHDAHNNYLLIASEMGVPALLVFLWIIWRIVKNSWKLYKISADPFIKAVGLGMLGGVPSLLISNIYGSRLNYIEVTCYFWVLAGIIVRWKMSEEEKLQNA